MIGTSRMLVSRLKKKKSFAREGLLSEPTCFPGRSASSAPPSAERRTVFVTQTTMSDFFCLRNQMQSGIRP